MSKRLRIGDIFEVICDSKTKRYFQYIGNDHSQLNMDVLRVFKRVYKENESLEIQEIVKDKIDFYALVTDVGRGVKEGVYTWFENSQNIGEIDKVYFRNPNCLMTSPQCERWFVWRINGERKLFNYTNKLVKIAYPGIGMPSKNFIHKIQHGVYPFVYPKYPGEK